ncbi:MAG: hypothetical protein ACKO2K_16060, partial [Alphaproteobacteria bacterium]
AEVAGGAEGRGDLRVVSGAIAGRNMVREVLVPVLGAEGTAAAPAGLATMLASADTAFDSIGGPVQLAGSRLSSPSIEARAGDFGATGRLAVASGGDVRFQGDLRIEPAAAREVVALLPGGASLVNDDGSLTLPFSVQGTWPDVRVTVDAERFAARTLLRRGFARLFAALSPLG